MTLHSFCSTVSKNIFVFEFQPILGMSALFSKIALVTPLSDVRHYAKILQWALIVRPHLLVRWRGPVSCNQSLEMSPSQGRVTAKVSVVFAQHFQT